MKNLFTQTIKSPSARKLLCSLLVFFSIFSFDVFSQTPIPTITLDGFYCNFNNPDGQNAYRCGTIVTANITLPTTPSLESFTLTIPNSFEVIGSMVNYSTDIIEDAGSIINYVGSNVNISNGDLVKIKFLPDSGASLCTVRLAYRNCNVYNDITGPTPPNFSKLFFNCGGQLPLDSLIKRPTLTANFSLVNTNLAARLTGININAIEVTTANPTNLGYTNITYSRTFVVKLNSFSIDSFQVSINNENDINTDSLKIINGSNTLDLTSSFIYGTAFNNFNVSLLNSSNLIASNRTITFRQWYKINCSIPSTSTSVRARLSCNCSTSSSS